MHASEKLFVLFHIQDKKIISLHRVLIFCLLSFHDNLVDDLESVHYAIGKELLIDTNGAKLFN